MTALPLQQPLYGQQVKGNLTAQDLARLQLAQQLLKSGTDTSPIESPWQGVARLGQALAGAYGNYRVGKDVTEREGETASTMAQALRATKGSWTNPDTGQAMPIPNAQGGMEGAMSVLAGNPNTAGQAAQMGFAQLTEQQKLANALKEYRGKGEIDLEQKPKLRGLELAAEIQPKLDLRQGELNQNLTMNPQIAAATAKAENPFLINRATSIHAANRDKDVSTAGQLEANQTVGRGVGGMTPIQTPWGTLPVTQATQTAQNMAGGIRNVGPAENVIAVPPAGSGGQPQTVYQNPNPVVPGSPDSSLATGLSGGVAKDITEGRDKGLLARTSLGTSDTVVKLLDSGAITGTGAGWRTALERGLSTAGIVGPGRVANTEALFSTLGRDTMALVKNLGAGSGISNVDLAFAERVAGGKEGLSEQGLRQIVAMNREMARKAIMQQNADVLRQRGAKGVNPEVLGHYLVIPPGIPDAAANDLINSPNTRDQFDQVFGKGSAALILGR